MKKIRRKKPAPKKRRLTPKRRDTKWYRAAIDRLAAIGHKHTEDDQGSYCYACPYGEPAPELTLDPAEERELRDQFCECCQLCVEGSCCGSYPEYNCPGDCYARGQEGHYALRTDGGRSEFPERAGGLP